MKRYEKRLRELERLLFLAWVSEMCVTRMFLWLSTTKRLTNGFMILGDHLIVRYARLEIVPDPRLYIGMRIPGCRWLGLFIRWRYPTLKLMRS